MLLFGILSLLLTSIGVLGFKHYNIFKMYISYLYLLISHSMLFILGWNLAILYVDSKVGFIFWEILITILSLLGGTVLIHFLADKKDYHDNTDNFHQW